MLLHLWNIGRTAAENYETIKNKLTEVVEAEVVTFVEIFVPQKYHNFLEHATCM